MSVRIIKSLSTYNIERSGAVAGDICICEIYIPFSGGCVYGVLLIVNEKNYEVIAEFSTMKRAVRYAVMREELQQDIKDQIHTKADELIREFNS